MNLALVAAAQQLQWCSCDAGDVAGRGVMTMVVRRQWPQSVAISRPRMVVVGAQ